ncbi:MAG: phosphate acyltransferase [Elusimicrobiales bacterium]|nr:phosphate acyltransferase [Elusimicrobiales bacterium]
MHFRDFDELLSAVKGKPNRVAVPGANNIEALAALKMADDNGLIQSGLLIGEPAQVRKMAGETGLGLSKFEIIACSDPVKMCEIAAQSVAAGKADFLVKGLVDTKYYMKALLDKELGLVPPGALLSHFVLMRTPRYKKPFGLADAAILIDPDIEQKTQIVRNAVNVMRALGVERPKVSVVCPVEKPNDKIPSTLDAVELARRAREGIIKNAVVEGPYDIYITFSRRLADEKGVKGGSVPGEADIALFDDLDAANSVYKSILFFGEAVRSAAILVGARIPVVLSSRADSPDTKLNSIALACMLRDKNLVD